MNKQRTKAELLTELEQAHKRIAALEAATDGESKAHPAEKQSASLRALMEALDLSLCRWRPDTTLTYANEKYRQLFGLPGEITGQKWLNFLPEATRAATAAFYAEVAKHPRTVTNDRAVLGEDGNVHQYHWIDIPLLDKHGKILEFQSVGLDVTERKQAEEKLSQSETQYRYLFENNPYPMLAFDAQTLKFLAVNDAAIEKYGYSRHEFLNMTIADIRPEADAKRLREFNVGELPVFHHAEGWQHKLKDGTLIDVEISSHAINFGGQQARLVIAQDITARKQAEEKMRESESQYRLLVETSKEGIWAMDREHRTTYVNQAMADMLGYQPSDMLGKKVEEFFFTEDMAFHQKRMQIRHAGQDENYERRFQRRDGSPLWTLVSARSLKDAQGNFDGSFAMFTDITERKQAEEKLRESEARFHGTLDAMQEGVLLIGKDWRYLYINKSAEIQGRRPAEELLGKTVMECWPGIEATAFFQLEQRGMQELLPAQIEAPFAFPDGVTRWFHWNVQPTAEGLLIVTQDITERKQAEEKLRESEERFQQIADHIGEVVWMFDHREQKLIYLNAAYEKIWGCSIAETYQDTQRYIGAIHPADRGIMFAALARQAEGASMEMEYRVLQPDGSIHWIYDRAFPIFGAGGTLIRTTGIAADITERKQAEEAQRESERKLSTLLSNLVGFAYRCKNDHDWTMEYISSGCQAITGYLPEDFIGNRTLAYNDLIHPADQAYVWTTIQKALSARASYQIEYRLNTRAGIERWVWEQGRGIFEDETLQALEGFITDVTERKTAEQALRASEEKYRGLMESLDAVVSMFDADGRLIYLNEVAASQFGGTVQEMVGKTMPELFPEPVAARQLGSIRRVIAEDRPLIIEAPSVIQGQPRWYRNSIQPIHDEYGGVMYALVNATDIHELKTIQQELLELNRTLEERVKERTTELESIRQRLELATQTAKLGVWDWNIKTGQLLWDEQVYAIYGLSKETFKVSMEAFLALVYPEDVASLVQFSQAAISNRPAGQIEYRIIRGDGALGYVKVHGAIVCDAEGQPEHVVGVAQDITAEKLAEKNLRESEERYRRAISAAGAVPYNLDYGTNTYTFLGEEIEKITGYGRDELTPALFDQIIEQTSMRGDLGQLSTEAATRRVRAGDPGVLQATWRSDFRIRKKNGELSWLSDSSVQILDRLGKPSGSIGILQDITERKRAEETLRHANIELARAMRMKDEFLANMSHELRTPLNGILGLSEALQFQTYGTLSEKQLRAIKNIESSGRHLLGLINDILDLSKIEAGKLEIHVEPVSVADLCQASLSFVKEPAIKKRVAVAFMPDPLVTTVLVDMRRLKQILVNLLSNAVKFTPAGGKITLKVQANLQQHMVDFSVSDTGVGIAPDDLARLFNPFTQVDSSLTRQHEGTGLGLALVKELTEMHGGNVRVSSAVGEGSTFTVSLPWQPEAPAPEPTFIHGQTEAGPISAQETHQRLETILLAEDVELNIVTIGDYLESQGYHMIYALNGREAIEKARAYSPALILMDVQMPVMDGLEATRQLRTDPQFATVPVIALTAMAMTGDRDRCLEAGASAYVSKPVSLKELAETIRALLAQKHKSSANAAA